MSSSITVDGAGDDAGDGAFIGGLIPTNVLSPASGPVISRTTGWIPVYEVALPTVLNACTLTITNQQTGQVAFGPASGTPMSDAGGFHRLTWNAAGTVPVGVYNYLFASIRGGAGQTPETGVLNISAGAGPQYPPIPAHLVGIGTWRKRLTRSLSDNPLPLGFDVTTGLPLTTTLPSLFTPDDLDDAFRAGASLLSEYIPRLRSLPPLTFNIGVSTYALPPDFRDPDTASWGTLLGPTLMESGALPGSRYAYQRYQDMVDSPRTSLRGRGGSVYGYYGAGAYGLGGDGMGLGGFGFGYDAQGNLTAGGGTCARGIHFYSADFDHSTPYMTVGCLSTSTGSPMAGLLYKAGYVVYRLTSNAIGTAWQASDGTDWSPDTTKSLNLTTVAPGDSFNPLSDVLSFVDGEDALRLSLRYARYWLLTEKILLSADRGDSVTYAFYSQSTGQSRMHIIKIAESDLAAFQARTSRRARSGRG